MVLKETVIFEGYSANSAEDSTIHEMIGVRAKAVNDV